MAARLERNTTCNSGKNNVACLGDADTSKQHSVSIPLHRCRFRQNCYVSLSETYQVSASIGTQFKHIQEYPHKDTLSQFCKGFHCYSSQDIHGVDSLFRSPPVLIKCSQLVLKSLSHSTR